MERDGLVTVVYEICHTPEPPHHPGGLEEYAKLLTPHLSKDKDNKVKGSIEVSNRMNSLILTDTKENIEHLEKILQLVHTADAPIMIEARVVEVRWDSDLQIGFEGDLTTSATIWQKPGTGGLIQDVRARFSPQDVLLTPTSPFQGSTFRFNSTNPHRGTIGGLVNFFVENGRANVLSQPRTLVQAGETATVFAGDEIPIATGFQTQPAGGIVATYQYKPVGVTLEVTPHLAAPGQVSMKLRPEVSSQLGVTEISPGLFAPNISTRRAQTELLIRDGDEVVIGGLVRKDKTQVRRGIPFLSDIPILGYLFGKYEESETTFEVLFFIKPVVIKKPEDLPRQMRDPLRDK